MRESMNAFATRLREKTSPISRTACSVREIQQLPQDHPVRELWKVIAGAETGRVTETQITLFDSVGFATEDFSALRYVRDKLSANSRFQNLDLVADPDEPRDLFGMLMRHQARAAV
ncbi:hypothetical protein AJ87_07765 [Rhizobium yanglingense]|nr:hypothetical protein AJ87_07765 [Rhizobium yanglingense]